MEESAAANRCQPAAEHQGAGLAGISANKQVNKPSLIGPLEQLRRVLEAMEHPSALSVLKEAQANISLMPTTSPFRPR